MRRFFLTVLAFALAAALPGTAPAQHSTTPAAASLVSAPAAPAPTEIPAGLGAPAPELTPAGLTAPAPRPVEVPAQDPAPGRDWDVGTPLWVLMAAVATLVLIVVIP